MRKARRSYMSARQLIAVTVALSGAAWILLWPLLVLFYLLYRCSNE